MELKTAFGHALRQCRKSRGLTQEDFAELSSRTYLSVLERGLKGPTLDKVDELSREMGIHPLTLLTGCYLRLESEVTIEQIISRVTAELQQAGFHQATAQS